MTDWRQVGWCDRCEVTLDNGGPGDGIVCPECGFDSRKAQEERFAAGGALDLCCGSHTPVCGAPDYCCAGCPAMREREQSEANRVAAEAALKRERIDGGILADLEAASRIPEGVWPGRIITESEARVVLQLAIDQGIDLTEDQIELADRLGLLEEGPQLSPRQHLQQVEAQNPPVVRVRRR